jgi:hypothetical protein
MSIAPLLESLAAASPYALIATATLGGLIVLLALWYDDVHLARDDRTAVGRC